MKICGYTLPPVVASFLLTSCIKNIEPPCIDLSLTNNQLTISASSLESICKNVSYTKNVNGTYETTARRYDHEPTKLEINDLIVNIDGTTIRNIPGDSYSIQTRLQIPIENGFHEIKVTACNEKNICDNRKLPVFSYGNILVQASTITNDQQPPTINGDLIIGKRILCRRCSASDLNGIAQITLEQDNTTLASEKILGFRQIVDYSSIIDQLQIDKEKKIIITAYDQKGNSTPLEISFDGYASTGIGGF